MRQGIAVLRFGLPIVALRNGTFLEPDLLQPCHLAEAVRRVLRDLELAVQSAQLDVSGRDGRDHGQHDGAFPLLGREQVRARRLGRAAQFAPYVELEARREIHPVVVDGPTAGQGRIGAGALARRRDAGVDLRKLRRAHDAVLRGGLIDAGRRDLEILVIGERRSHQLRQDRILELIPPCDVGNLDGFGGAESPSRGHVDLGAPVVRADHAGRQRRDQHECNRSIA